MDQTSPVARGLPRKIPATGRLFNHSRPGAGVQTRCGEVLHFCSSPKPWESKAPKGDLEQFLGAT